MAQHGLHYTKIDPPYHASTHHVQVIWQPLNIINCHDFVCKNANESNKCKSGFCNIQQQIVHDLYDAPTWKKSDVSFQHSSLWTSEIRLWSFQSQSWEGHVQVCERARKKLCHLSPGRLSDLALIWGLILQWGLLQVPQWVFTFWQFLTQESQVCSGIIGNPGSICCN